MTYPCHMSYMYGNYSETHQNDWDGSFRWLYLNSFFLWQVVLCGMCRPSTGLLAYQLLWQQLVSHVTYEFLNMASQNAQISSRSSSKVPFNRYERAWAFVLLLALGEKPPRFKFDINRLKPVGVMGQKPTAYIMQMRSFWQLAYCLFRRKISGGI